MAVAMRQVVTPARLLDQWQGEGFHLVKKAIVRQIPGDALGNPIVHLQLDAFEWLDVSFLGWGNVDDAVPKLRTYIQAAGSDLYGYALFERDDFNALGVSVKRYRLLLDHSQVQLLGAALVIMTAAFAAVVFWQYVTTGQAPALKDLQNLWGSAVSSTGAAVGSVGAAISGTYITAVVALGGIAFLYSIISKQAGVKAPPAPRAPSGSLGVRAGPVSARAST